MAGIKRRLLLQRLGEHLAEAATRASVELAPPQRRPPGALPEAEFLLACTRCGACTEACPPKAVFTFADSAGYLAGTPVMLPEQRPCVLCEGFPCAAACDVGALSLRDAAAVALGTVRIAPERCLAHLGPECGACVGLCPGDRNAIRLRAGKPQVDPQACVGCGLCIQACPVQPPAIEMVPLDIPCDGPPG